MTPTIPLLLAALALAGCAGLPGTPPPGTPSTSSSRGSAFGPQPENSLPPGDRVNGPVIPAVGGPGTVTTRVGL